MFGRLIGNEAAETRHRTGPDLEGRDVVVRNQSFLPRGSLARDGWETVADATLPGWAHTGIRVADLLDGSVPLAAEITERMIVPLAGSSVVETAEHTWTLAGRASVFDGPTDVLYLGIETAARISGTGRVAVAEAPA